MRKRHFENIDAMRFMAFLPVFFTHAFFTGNPGILSSEVYGFFENHLNIALVGVDFFFVLSSFLITWIILEEYSLTKRFNIIHFWVRRSLRIWPLYFAIVALGFIAVRVSSAILHNPTSPLPPWYHFVFFTLNFYCVKHGVFFLFFLAIFWSVAIEEQFYLFWALVLKFVRKSVFPISFFLIFISLLFRWKNLHDNNSLVFHTFSSLSNFAIGAIAAQAAFNRGRIFNFLTTVSRETIGLVYIIFLLNLIFYPRIYFTPVFIIFERFIFACFFGFIVLEQCFCKNSLFKLGKVNVINYLGVISFGLYCYHGIVITFIRKFVEQNGLNDSWSEVFFINPLIILLATIIIATVSYEFFEKRIIQLKNRFYTVKR